MKTFFLISRAASGTLAIAALLLALFCPFAYDLAGGGQMGAIVQTVCFCMLLPFFAFGLIFMACDEKLLNLQFPNLFNR